MMYYTIDRSEKERYFWELLDQWVETVGGRDNLRKILEAEWRDRTRMRESGPPEFRLSSPRRLGRVWVRYRLGNLERGVLCSMSIARVALELCLANGVNDNPRIDLRRMLDDEATTDGEVADGVAWLHQGTDIFSGHVYNAHLFKFWKEARK